MSFIKAVENRFNRLRKQRDEGRITEDEFLKEVEKLQFQDEQGKLWMIDASSGNWYFEENGQWVSDEPPKFEPAILCSRCGQPVQNVDSHLCNKCQAEVAAALAQAKSSGAGEKATSAKRVESPAQAEPKVEAAPEMAQGDVTQVFRRPQTSGKAAQQGAKSPPQDEQGWVVSESESEQRAQFFYDRGVEQFDAGHWQEALDFFEQALRLAPAYRDARKLASVARTRLESEKERRLLESKLGMLYERAQQQAAEGHWQDAYDLFQEVLSLEPDYRDARELSEKALAELIVIEERRRQTAALEALYRQGEADFKAGRWAKSVELLSQVRELDPAYFADDPRWGRALEILAEAERQLELETLYTSAAQAAKEKRWADAAPLLQRLVSLDPNYQNAQELLKVAEQQDFLERQRVRGMECLVAGLWGEAMESFDAVLQISPNDSAVRAGWLYARGRELARTEQWAEAMETFSQLMAIDASYRDVAAQLARCKNTIRLQDAYQAGLEHLKQGRRKEALRAFEIVSSIDPNYQDVGQRLVETRAEIELADLYEQGNRYAEGHRLSEAVAVFEQIVAKREDYRDAQARLAELRRLKRLADLYAQGASAFRAGKWSEAMIDLKRVIELDPEYRDAAYLYQEAQRQDRLHDLYRRGLECLDEKDWTRAIEHLEQVVTEDEAYRDAMAKLMEARRQRQLTGLYREGESRFAEGDWAGALAAFEKMLSLDPNDEWGVMARLRESRRQRDLAQMYAQAIQLYQEQRWQEASQLFEKLVQEEPNYQDSSLKLREIDKQEELTTLYAKAQEYRTAGQWDAAIEIYQRILRIDKDYQNAAQELEEARLRKKIVTMYQEGQAFMEQKKWARAVEVFERLLTFEPESEDVRARLAEARKQQNLADLYAEAVRSLEQGHCQEAVECFEKVMVVDASYRDVQTQLEQARERQRFLQFVEKGKALYEQDDYEGAIGVLRRAVEIDPADAQVREVLKSAQQKLETVQYYQAGLRYFENRQWAEAIDFLSRVIERDPDFRDAAARLQSATTQRQLSELYENARKAMKAQDWPEAVRHLDQIVEIDGNYENAADQLAYAREQIRAKLMALYTKGKEHLAAGRWQSAIEIFEKLQREQAGFADVDRLLRDARNLQEQTELAALYEQGMRCLVGGDWALAIEYFERVQARAPDYKDVDAQLKLARQRQLQAYVAQAESVNREVVPTYIRPVSEFEEVVEPEPQGKGWPFATIAFGSVGLLLCCMTVLGLLLIVGQSYYPLDAQRGGNLVASIAALLTPAGATYGEPSLSLAAPTLTVASVDFGYPAEELTPVVESRATGPAIVAVELITATLLEGAPSPTAVATQELGPPVRSLQIPDLPTSTPTALATSTVEAGVGMASAAQPGNALRVPPSAEGAMQQARPSPATGTEQTRETEADSDRPTARPSPTPEPTEELPAPLSGKIAFSVYDPAPRRYTVYLANADGSGMNALFSDAGAPALSVDGALLAYRSWANEDRRIMVFDLTSGQYVRLTGFAEDSRPDWSQNGELVFDSSRESDRGFRLYTIGYWVGAADRSLLDETGRSVLGSSPAWLGAGRIAYSSCTQGCGVYVVNADGSGASKVVDTLDRVSLDGSPDGNRIVYAAREDGRWDIFLIGADGSGALRITDDDAADWLPTWSPDGSYVAFVSNRDGNWAIWACTPDGKNLKKLFDLPGSPDGLVRDEPAWNSQGWIGERISWAP